jgi:hypothetical protein
MPAASYHFVTRRSRAAPPSTCSRRFLSSHDVLYELTRDRVVNILRDGRESHTVFRENCADRDVVGKAASEAIELVHSDDVDLRVIVPALGEHPCEFAPVRRPS